MPDTAVRPRPAAAGAPPSFAAFAAYWLRFGCINFGGPAGQIAMMQADLVERRGWIDLPRFLHGLNFCMLLPGPEAQQLATYLGWRLFGVAGGLVAGLLFLLPGAILLLGLSWLAAAHGEAPLVAAVFDGIKPVVVAIIAVAVWRIARRTLAGPVPVVLAAAAFLGLYVLAVPFPALVLAAGLVGAAATRAGRRWFAPHADGVPGSSETVPAAPKLRRLAGLALLFLVLWAVPVGLVLRCAGAGPWDDLALLFTKAAFVTFGGAYAVLPYVAAAAVGEYGWLGAADMINGLALAETTPGPLILVVQYVGFFAGWTHATAAAGWLSPAAAGVLASLLVLYVTFLPCFFFIFAGAPYLEWVIRNRALAGALAAITAAVVGVMLNLGVVLAGHMFRQPDGTPDGATIATALAAAAALAWGRVPIHWLVPAGAALGLATAWLGRGLG